MKPSEADAVVVVEGVVEHGDHRGRLLGFPTANLRVPEELDEEQLRDGVWAGVVEIEGGARHVAAVSVGRRPTFYTRDGERLIESYLLDFTGDLYGLKLTVELYAYLRPQLRFADEEALILQMRQDVEDCRTLGLGA